MDKQERYNAILDYWKERKPFKNEDEIPDVPIVQPHDYEKVIIPNIIRCGGIPKDKLEIGKTYVGSCRNASEATWDGKRFNYKRVKFGMEYEDSVNHFQDDDGYDLFIPLKIKE